MTMDQLIKAADPFATVVQRTRMPMLLSDATLPNNPIIFANDSFLALTGYARQEVIGKSYDFLKGPHTAPHQFEEALNRHFEGFPEICLYRKDRTMFWASMLIGPVINVEGVTTQHFLSFMDVSERRQNEQLNFLLEELSHRVKNTLATVQSIVSQTLRNANVDLEVRDAVDNRIFALSQAHELVARSGSAGTNLLSVIEKVLKPFRAGRTDRFFVKGESVLLLPKAALALAMMFHELMANAVKYGSFSADGRIDITWRVERSALGNRIKLKWEESGGPFVNPPTRTGFGTRLIQQRLAHELDGEVHIDFEPTGVVCRVELPNTPP